MNASAAANDMNVISAALVNMKKQTKRRRGTTLSHIAPPTEAVETVPPIRMKTTILITAHTAPVVIASAMQNPAPRANAHAHHHPSLTRRATANQPNRHHRHPPLANAAIASGTTKTRKSKLVVIGNALGAITLKRQTLHPATKKTTMSKPAAIGSALAATMSKSHHTLRTTRISLRRMEHMRNHTTNLPTPHLYLPNTPLPTNPDPPLNRRPLPPPSKPNSPSTPTNSNAKPAIKSVCRKSCRDVKPWRAKAPPVREGANTRATAHRRGEE